MHPKAGVQVDLAYQSSKRGRPRGALSAAPTGRRLVRPDIAGTGPRLPRREAAACRRPTGSGPTQRCGGDHGRHPTHPGAPRSAVYGGLTVGGGDGEGEGWWDSEERRWGFALPHSSVKAVDSRVHLIDLFKECRQILTGRR
jgi:hypothetical protein